jgi:glutamine synthetase
MTSINSSSQTFDSIKAQLQDQAVKFIRFEFADLHGIARSKLVPLEQAIRYWDKGLNVYGGTLGLDTASEVVSNTGLNEEISYADMRIVPDASTLYILPYKPNTAAVICDLYDSNLAPLAASPRHILQTTLAKAHNSGYTVLLGHEYEFYLYDQETLAPLFDGLHIFNTQRNESHPAIDAILNALIDAGIPVITHNAEYAGSQFEINYAPATGITAADRAFRFKSIVKEVAAQHGLVASLMSKPDTDKAGSGCHLHLSLLETASGNNTFWDTTQANGLSTVAQQFIGGTLENAEALTALACPTINCYHRLKPHTFAPSNISWGIEDRSALIRGKCDNDESTHIELRLASAMSNPYLLAAGLLISGLDGIKQQNTAIAPSASPAEDEDHWRSLPPCLEQALHAFNSNTLFNHELSPAFTKLYNAVKSHEINRFHQHVTDWEINEYLTLY